MGMMSAYKHFMKALTSEYFDHSSFPFFFSFFLKDKKRKMLLMSFCKLSQRPSVLSSLKDPPARDPVSLQT